MRDESRLPGLCQVPGRCGRWTKALAPSSGSAKLAPIIVAALLNVQRPSRAVTTGADNHPTTRRAAISNLNAGMRTASHAVWKTVAVRIDATTRASDFSSRFVFIVFTVVAGPSQNGDCLASLAFHIRRDERDRRDIARTTSRAAISRHLVIRHSFVLGYFVLRHSSRTSGDAPFSNSNVPHKLGSSAKGNSGPTVKVCQPSSRSITA